MLSIGVGAAHGAEIQSNSGQGGADATSPTGIPTNGTSGGAVNFNDTTPLNVSDGGFQTIWVGALSLGGYGGNAYRTGTDGNGTPQYASAGGAAGSGGDVGLLLNAPVTAYSGVQYGPSTSAGVRTVIAQSAGGNAGVGWYGLNGGSAGNVGLESNAAVSLAINWGSPQFEQAEGLAAISQGGNGTATTRSGLGTGGGNGGDAGEVALRVNSGGDVAIDQANTPQSGNFAPAFPNPNPVAGPFHISGNAGAPLNIVGAGIVASSWGGSGGGGYDHAAGGKGGNAQSATVKILDASVAITSSGLAVGGSGQAAILTPGVLAQSVGGRGGDGGLEQNHSSGGAGGASGAVNLLFAATPATPVGVVRSISTQALQSPAIAALAFGGAGGDGTNYDAFNVAGAGGDGGAAGVGGAVTVTMGSPALPASVKVSTALSQSPGIYAVSTGGDGGTGGYYAGGASGNGGAGGAGGDGSAVQVVTYGDIATAGDASAGIWALSQGGQGGAGGCGGYDGVHMGIPSCTQSGINQGGTGGNGGDTGTVTVTANSGTISTSGISSPGILAQSLSGTAGSGGDSGSLLFGTAGGAGAGGATGAMSIASFVSIITMGDQSPGILVQNQSGNGGSAGDAMHILYSQGGNGGYAGTIGDTHITVGGSIETHGQASHGIEVQSLSGGGGDAGNSAGLIGVGGSGGTGQNAGTIEAALSGSIRTYGGGSNGVMLQAIGGGGGSAADINDGTIVAVGGSGGVAGTGGVITLTNSGLIATSGDNSIGILAQSIGAGGGSAGGSLGVIAVGGSGSANGAGGNITFTNQGVVQTQGYQSYGIVAQSVGGGGGVGGGTGLSVIAVGGSDGAAGDGGQITLNQSGQVTTQGDQAHGVIGQSIGGGGGIGGDAIGALAIGGTDQASGKGGTVGINVSGAVTTMGDNAHGIAAVSTGGGGGVGGNATSASVFVDFAIGGEGGSGGAGGSATITTAPGTMITTYGTASSGIVAHSAGDGGGIGGGGSGFAVGVGFAASVALGGSGGGGGSGGSATVNLSGTTITTGLATASATNPETQPDQTILDVLPVDGSGVVVQSIGGGGGMGGSAAAKAFAIDIPNPFEPAGNFAISGTFALGGTGGAGGNGGTATINLSNGSNILTYGNGGFGLAAQSVGGGGGIGGDSSANSITFGLKDVSSLVGKKNYNIALSYANGGSGGGGGYGGPINITLGGTNFQQDSDGTPASSVQTLGDYAFGVLAQSVGGGGGNAGVGAGSTQNMTSSSSAITMALSVGGIGGSGGAGGKVQVTQFANAPIATFGDTSYGILAQSVGGGGGTSAGGSFQAGLPTINTVQKILGGEEVSYVGALSSKITIKAGADGGSGGNGGEVDVRVHGQISTAGEAAAGVVALSVGGGGGVAGSAGSSGSSDNPYVPTTGIAGIKDAKKLADNGMVGYLFALNKAIENDQSGLAALKAYLPSYAFNLSFGASGGTGGNGGPVNVALDHATITTEADYAKGVIAASVGGGGGIGGAAAAGGTKGIGSFLKIQFDAALGGSGGAGGVGGAVRVDTGGTTISTSGFAATGLLAMSVGGGGGIVGSAEFNASSALSLGMTHGGSGGLGVNGGTVTLAQTGSEATTIATTGMMAHGVILQSIGGGGGIAEEGYGLAASALTGYFGGYNPTFSFKVGGSNGGNGGTVQTDSANLPLLNISTSGDAAFGLIAQSIGGGGGIAGLTPGIPGTYAAGGANPNSVFANGGTVNIALKDGSRIVTTGNSSTALFAQSVGGGGGIASLGASDTASFYAQPYYASLTLGLPPSYGDGGAVTINTGKIDILTTGANSHGIFAQSVGSGGGIWSSGDGLSGFQAGTRGGVNSNGGGNTITITQAGSVITKGYQSIGIFAQSTGQTNEKNVNTPINGAININVNGYVSGGTGPAAWGIWVDSTNSVNNINIGSGGTVRADSGQAIRATDSGYNHVYNSGVVVGSYSLGTHLYGGTFSNQSGGVLLPQGSLAGDLSNSGMVVLASVPENMAATLAGDLIGNRTTILASVGGPQATTLVGNFTQAQNGLIITQANFSAGTIDRLAVSGNAALDGQVQVLSSNLLPNRPLIFLDVAGSTTGTLDAVQSNMFDFLVTQTGGSYSVSATADFNQPIFGLNSHQARAAEHLQAIWNAGGGNLGPVFGALANINLASYPGVLSNLTSEALSAPGAESISLAQQHLDRLMSCPIFEGATAIVTQTSCVWAVGSGQYFDQSAFGDASGYSDTVYSYAMGMQKEIAPNWFFGFAAGYDDSLITGNAISVDGSTGWIGATVKYETGPWLFAAAATGSFGTFDTSRTTYLGSIGGLAEGSTYLGGIGGRLRAAYTFAGERFYARPYLDFDLLYSSLSGYSEAGAGLLDRQVAGSSQWAALATPAVEFGTRIDLAEGSVLRGYVKTGVTFSSLDGWSSTVSLLAAPAGVDGFSVVLPMDQVYARIGAGVDLTGLKNGFALRAEYEGAFSEHTSRNMGSLRLSLDF